MACLPAVGEEQGNSWVLHHLVINLQSAAMENTKWLVYVRSVMCLRHTNGDAAAAQTGNQQRRIKS